MTESDTRFTPRQIRAMALIADTFLPGGDGAPSASAVGSHEFALELAAKNPRAAELRQLQMILDLWNTRSLGLALGGRPRRFADLSQSEREQVLLKLSDSRLPAKRGLFSALKGAALTPYYMTCGEAGWKDIGYPGPPGVIENPPAPRLTPLRVTSDTELSCDVVVVGSGAGGGTAAGVLAAAGLDVIVLEAGEMHDERDFDGSERHGIGDLYSPAPTATLDGQILLVAGHGLGGGTVVNWTTSFRTPQRVREEWAGHGVGQFAEQEFDDALDAVCSRLGVNTDHDKAAPRDALLEQGARALGWNCAAMPRNVIGCDQGVECGGCGMGCRIGAKQSTVKTWLTDAADAGARIYTGVRAMRVTSQNGTATGVEARSVNGHSVTVHARAVVVAAGAIQTPALLQRSGLQNRNIGCHLRLHPPFPVVGYFDERVDPWVGSMQSRYVDEHLDLDGDGYGVLYETGPMTPAFASNFVSWRGGADFRERMGELGHAMGIAVIVRDKDSLGIVKAGRDGEPVVRYRLSAHDQEHAVRGIEGAARMAEAAGAHTIRTTHHRPVRYRPGQDGDLARFVEDCRYEGFAPGRAALAALHIMGSARMGGSASTSAVNPDGRAWDMPGLYVADASCFPTSLGVNPMITIEAIAYMTAKRIAAQL